MREERDMVSVDVLNLTRRPVSEAKILHSVERIIAQLRGKEQFSFLREVRLSVVFVGSARMRKLNAMWRHKDKPTDVLSFVLQKRQTKLSGEIILCPAVIQKKEYGIPIRFDAKVEHLLIHAILHLCGFDHQTDSDWKKMEKIAAKLS